MTRDDMCAKMVRDYFLEIEEYWKMTTVLDVHDDAAKCSVQFTMTRAQLRRLQTHIAGLLDERP